MPGSAAVGGDDRAAAEVYIAGPGAAVGHIPDPPCDPSATSSTLADVRRRLPVSPCVPGFNPLGFLLMCVSRRGRQTSVVDFPFNPMARVQGYPFILSQALTGGPLVSAPFFFLNPRPGCSVGPAHAAPLGPASLQSSLFF
jgi:hypothetical protein